MPYHVNTIYTQLQKTKFCVELSRGCDKKIRGRRMGDKYGNRLAPFSKEYFEKVAEHWYDSVSIENVKVDERKGRQQ
jgi:hypothetical protein